MKDRIRIVVISLLSICFLILGVSPTYGSSVKKRNVVDLISLADMIVVGKIVTVTDGIDGNKVPYTEVTIDVSEAIRGAVGNTYTFRQFGLLQPRDMGKGYVNLNVTPEGWATYQEGKEVMLFLYKAATLTGLRTTVGLFQGKFNIENGRVSNRINNKGLFDKVSVEQQIAEENVMVEKLLKAKKGPINAEMFISFVRKAVQERWIEERRMSHEK